MSLITICARCRKAVSVPGGLESDATVRCPLCEGEYALADAMTQAVEGPPELVPVARVSMAIDEGDAAPSAGATLCEVSAAEQEPAEPRDDSPHTYAVASGEHGHVSRPVPADEQADGLGRLDFMTQTAGGPGHAASPGQGLSNWRSRQHEITLGGLIGKFLGIAVFGLLGIAAAYLAMSWISPARFDFLHVWGAPQKAMRQPAAVDGNSGSSPVAPAESEKEKWGLDR